MERIYTVLLDRGGRTTARPYLGHAALEQPLESTSRLLSEPPRPVLHREKLTTQELQELAAEPEFVAAAEIMCTRLLSPLPEQGIEARVTVAGGRRRQSWGISAVGADRSKYNGADVPVAMLDTGIDAEHRAFRDVDLVQKDFTGLGNGDASGHGTHCAGIVFGRNVDGVRIGVAPGVRRALIGKVLGPDGGDSDMLTRGIAWAHEQCARVISMSVGYDFAATVKKRVAEGWPDALATAGALEAYRANLRLLDRLLLMLRMQEPFTGGAIIVAAAGNDSRRSADGEYVMTASPPCGSDKVVSVGSFDPSASGGYRISSFSNCGVEITAPGRGIVSAAAGGGLKALSGTSMAAPHVAGVAALWWQAVKQSELPANATLVRGKLLSGAERGGFSASVYPGERGAGRAFAPLDRTAVAGRQLSTRSNATVPGLGSVGRAWPGEGLQRAVGADFEPIAIGGNRGHSGWSGGGRLC